MTKIKYFILFTVLIINSCAKVYVWQSPEINESTEQLIMSSMKDGDVKTLRQLFKNNPSLLNYINRTNDASLAHIAAVHNNVDVLELLIELKVPLNYQNKLRASPLGYAISNHKNEIALKLIDSGADVINIFRGQTAMHYCALYDNSIVARKLIEKGFDVNIRSKNIYGVPPLQDAALKCNPKIFKLLIDNDAKVSKRSRLGFSIKGDAQHSQCPEILELIEAAK